MSMQATIDAAIKAARLATEAANDTTPPPQTTESRRSQTTPQIKDDTSVPHIQVVAPHQSPGALDDVKTTEQAVRPLIRVKPLSEKAVLVTCKRSMFSPYTQDKDATTEYAAGNVSKHLFKGNDNRVKTTNSAFSKVYTHVKENTVPWANGVYLLNMKTFLQFTKDLRSLRADADRAVTDLVLNWDVEVDADLRRLEAIEAATGKTGLADIDDYPHADDIAARYNIDVQFMPVPKPEDFNQDIRMGVDAEELAEMDSSLNRRLDDAEANAATHVVKQMLEPMSAVAKKLSVPIGQDGSLFRETLIGNLVEVSDRMNRVNVSDDPAVQRQIDDLQALASKYSGNKAEILRHSPQARATAADEVKDLMGKMQGLV